MGKGKSRFCLCCLIFCLLLYGFVGFGASFFGAGGGMRR